VDEEADDEEGNKICVAEWVEKSRDKPISCSFLTYQSVIISLIYYFGEGLYDSPKDMSYLTLIF
jgi:hypothetical protein